MNTSVIATTSVRAAPVLMFAVAIIIFALDALTKLVVYNNTSYGWHWPVFNLADLAIVCGAGLMVLAAFAYPEPKNKPSAA